MEPVNPSFGVTLLVLGCLLEPAEAEDAPFRDVTEATGISFVHACGSKEKDWIIEVNGSGVALFDYDADGDLDIYFVNGSYLDGAARAAGTPASPPRDALYRNDGGWRFTDVTAAAGVGDEGWGGGAAVADVDNDGGRAGAVSLQEA